MFLQLILSESASRFRPVHARYPEMHRCRILFSTRSMTSQAGRAPLPALEQFVLAPGHVSEEQIHHDNNQRSQTDLLLQSCENGNQDISPSSDAVRLFHPVSHC